MTYTWRTHTLYNSVLFYLKYAFTNKHIYRTGTQYLNLRELVSAMYHTTRSSKYRTYTGIYRYTYTYLRLKHCVRNNKNYYQLYGEKKPVWISMSFFSLGKFTCFPIFRPNSGAKKCRYTYVLYTYTYVYVPREQ